MKSQHPTNQEIRNRAAQIYVQNGCKPGQDVGNWLQAEDELMQLPLDKIAELAPVKVKRDKVIRASVIGLVHAVLLLEANGLSQYLRQ